MLEKRASRVFRVDCFRYGKVDPEGSLRFFREIFHCDISTCGPALNTKGHDGVLQVMTAVLGNWFKRYWQGKALVSEAYIKHRPITEAAPAAVTPVIDSENMQNLVNFLHHKVAAILLKPQGIKTYQVVLRDITGNAVTSRLDDSECPQNIAPSKGLPAPFQFKKNTRKKKAPMVG